jgi:hypothetical protein
LTTESDIELVMNMVKNYSKFINNLSLLATSARTALAYRDCCSERLADHVSFTFRNHGGARSYNFCSILAIMPSNVDPATQEILKLAKKVDHSMTRTMAVLTKLDLAIERATQQIAIDHVLGKRGDLTLGYYIVKNRGADDVNKSLEQGQMDERQFFAKAPWSALSRSGRAGIGCLKQRVRELLIDLIKKEFPKLKSEVFKELSDVRAQHTEMGASRSDQHTQRAYLNRMSEAFQSLGRDALNAYYTGNQIFSGRQDLRLITRIVETSEWYSQEMSTNGHTRPFLSRNYDCDEISEVGKDSPSDASAEAACSVCEKQGLDMDAIVDEYPELEEIFDSWGKPARGIAACGIMDYIENVYKSTRGQDLGTVSYTLLMLMPSSHISNSSEAVCLVPSSKSNRRSGRVSP